MGSLSRPAYRQAGVWKRNLWKGYKLRRMILAAFAATGLVLGLSLPASADVTRADPATNFNVVLTNVNKTFNVVVATDTDQALNPSCVTQNNCMMSASVYLNGQQVGNIPSTNSGTNHYITVPVTIDTANYGSLYGAWGVRQFTVEDNARPGGSKTFSLDLRRDTWTGYTDNLTIVAPHTVRFKGQVQVATGGSYVGAQGFGGFVQKVNSDGSLTNVKAIVASSGGVYTTDYVVPSAGTYTFKLGTTATGSSWASGSSTKTITVP